MIRLRPIITLCIGLLASGPLQSATLTVTSASNAGAGSLRDTVAAAMPDDVIVFDPGLNGATITLASQIVIDKNLTITGPGATDLTISGNDSTRVLVISHPAIVNISGLTVSDGAASFGSGIFSTGTTTLTDCRLIGNSNSGSGAVIGGGVLNAASSAGNAMLTIERCSIRNNNSDGEGGGVGNVTFSDNLARTIIRDSSILNNTANFGAGLASYSQASGIAELQIFNSTVSGNQASIHGGGITVDNLGSGLISRLTAVHVTIHDNTAANDGGGVRSQRAGVTLTFRNSIVAGNQSNGGSDDIRKGNEGSDVIFAGGNVIGTDAGIGVYANHPSDQIGSGFVIDPLLNSLASNGGPTATHRPDPLSPAIDAALSVTCEATDQRGQMRPLDGNGDGVAACDSGAVEADLAFYSVGGTLIGLAGDGLVLRNNGGDDLPRNFDGNFTFATGVIDGGMYDVTVAQQPVDPVQTCSVSNGSGTVAGGNVTDVQVSCVTEFFNVGGTVSGLAGSGMVLANGADVLPISSNGSFAFSSPYPDGSPYNVSVQAQPDSPSQTCTVNNGTGTLSGSDVTDIVIDCQTNAFTVGGSVQNLAGSGLILSNNGMEMLPVNGNGAFVFTTALPDLSPYNVTVSAQPEDPQQNCLVSNGMGNLSGSDVSNVQVSCLTTLFTVGGTVSGLVGSGLTLEVNGTNSLSIAGNGPYTFPVGYPDGSAYEVTVAAHPGGPSQTCEVTEGIGMIDGAPVQDVAVDCVTDTFHIGGEVMGLSGSGLVLRNNGVDLLSVKDNGGFSFTEPVPDLGAYDVQVLAQPDDPAQACTVSAGSGNVNAADVTSVIVECIDRASAVLVPATVSFGNIPVGQSSLPEPVMLISDGLAPLIVDQVTVGGADQDEFMLTEDLCTGQSLEPGTHCDLSVVFAPLSAGPHLSQLIITSNGPGSPHFGQLAGEALDSQDLFISSFE